MNHTAPSSGHIVKGILLLSLCQIAFGQLPDGLSHKIVNGKNAWQTVQSKSFNLLMARTFTNLSFNQPTFLTNAGDSTNRIFVIERVGRISVFPNKSSVTVSEKKTFLDISSEVSSSAPSGEPGLLSMAFHPNYKNNGKFYVCYTDTIAGNIRDSVYAGAMMLTLSEFHVSSSNPDSADRSSERILLQAQKLWDNHNGGQIAFGNDGDLYMSIGDGKETKTDNDPFQNGQKMTTWFGKVLRIDVDSQDVGLQYHIPNDNPYVGNSDGWKEEIFATGFRNPWRFSFDRATGDLWLGDVGAKFAEEIDIVESGKNYGWSIMEGMHCFNSDSCDTSGLTYPIFEYLRDNKGTTIAITGGYVYHGTKFPELQGMYVYGDYGYKGVWALRYTDGVVTESDSLAIAPQRISSWGEDEEGEMYLVGYNGSNSYLYTFQPTGLGVDGNHNNIVPGRYAISEPYPNPFNPSNTVDFEIPHAGNVKMTVYNSLGQKIKELTNHWYERGSYTSRWDGKDSHGLDVSSGMYIYTIESENFKQSVKALLLR